MLVFFTHACPNCGRKRRMPIETLGNSVQCIQCGIESIAADPHNESLAMMDSIKDHAELQTTLAPKNATIRTPR